MRHILSLLLVLLIAVGCSYRFGSSGRKIPGGYTLVSVPVFQNKTKTVGIEAFFTRSMIDEIERSRLGQVTDREESQVIIEGTLNSVELIKGSEVSRDTGGNFAELPEGATLAREYRVIVRSTILLRKTSDMSVLWTSSFTGERRYPAAIVTRQVINTVNPLYNQNAQIESIRIVARDLVAEAFEQMTENF